MQVKTRRDHPFIFFLASFEGETSPPAALSPACLGHRMISNHGTTSIVFFQILPCSLLVAEALLTQPSSSSFSVSLFFCFSSQVLFHFSSNSRRGKFNRNYYNLPGCRLKKVRNHYFFSIYDGKELEEGD